MSISNDKVPEKEQFLSQNQALMETSAQLGGILVAILTFILAFATSTPEMLEGDLCQFVLVLVAAAVVSFFTATTFYLRGTNPRRLLDEVEGYNKKADIFFAGGLLCLLFIPLMLFFVLELYLAMALSSISFLIAWHHLFKDKVGIVAIKLSVLGIFLGKQARDTSSKKKNYLVIVPFYILMLAFTILGFYLWLFS